MLALSGDQGWPSRLLPKLFPGRGETAEALWSALQVEVEPLPDEPLADLARSATAALGALVASPLSVDELSEEVLAARVSLVVREDSSDHAWSIKAEWSEGDGRVELLEALAKIGRAHV